jgi:hypothetical protein
VPRRGELLAGRLRTPAERECHAALITYFTERLEQELLDTGSGFACQKVYYVIWATAQRKVEPGSLPRTSAM